MILSNISTGTRRGILEVTRVNDTENVLTETHLLRLQRELDEDLL